MSFHDMVRKDLDRVFFNLEEFAELHVINGFEMPCVIDRDENTDATVRSVMGVYASAIELRVRASDLKRLPKEGEPLSLDGQTYFVAEASSEMGLYVIVLQAHRS